MGELMLVGGVRWRVDRLTDRLAAWIAHREAITDRGADYAGGW